VDKEAAERAKRYRQQAADIAKAASEMKDLDSRSTLLRLAETYLRLAEKIEQDEDQE
jgi:hypothetical protein